MLLMGLKLKVKRDATATQLDDVTDVMDTYVARRRDNVSRDRIPQTAALTINQILALLMLDLASPTPELSKGKLINQIFLLIVKLAESLIRTGSVEWVVAPLHFTAVECQDLELRQTAISLLSVKSWRERPWDSAAIAQEIEEKSM